MTLSQAAVFAFLGDPATHRGAPVERIDTHISSVFLAGDRAYKIKRAVTLPFLDFSTPDQREAACRRELAINRRTAPDLYRAVLPITRTEDGQLGLGGAGPAIDWVVVMRRFDDRTLFNRLAAGGRLTDDHARQTADAIATLHAKAEPRSEWGGVRGMTHTIVTNDACFAHLANQPFDPATTADLTARSEQEVTRHAARLEARRHDGHVRQCHGDLHLGNICLVDGHPTLFDAIEFNDDFACIDCFYDLAFLLMDLRAKGLEHLSCLVFNRYIERTDDLGALALLPLFLSLRAAIRSHVSATMAVDDHDGRAALRTQASSYLNQAIAYLDPPPPRLVACGGLSGSGKSSLAAALAPAVGPPPGAVVLRSDVLRKRLHGVPAETPLGAAAYQAGVTGRTYDALYDRAERALRDGHSVVADAVFAQPEQRLAIEQLARRAGVPFHGLWLVSTPAILKDRVERRRGDASDATAAVVERQLGYDLGPLHWALVNSSGTPAATAAAAGRLIGLAAAGRAP